MGEPARKQQGRPTGYRPEYDELAMKACMAFGAKDTELADYFGVTEQTLNNWKHKHPSFFESIKEGREGVDMAVAKRLYDKAQEGDTTAMIYWLKCRRPKQWRDRQHIDPAQAVDVLGQLFEAIADHSRGLPAIEQD